MHDLSHHTRVSRCKSGIGWLMESLWANVKGLTMPGHYNTSPSWIYLDLLSFSDGNLAVVHIYQSQGWKCDWPLCHITLCTHECDSWVCHGGWFRTMLPGRLTLTGCPSLCRCCDSCIRHLHSQPMGSSDCRVGKIETFLWSGAPDRSSCDEWGPRAPLDLSSDQHQWFCSGSAAGFLASTEKKKS